MYIEFLRVFGKNVTPVEKFTGKLCQNQRDWTDVRHIIYMEDIICLCYLLFYVTQIKEKIQRL